jgi:D-3-phosphoglycerate dehydrogenase
MEVRQPIILKPYGSCEWEREVFASIGDVRGTEQPLSEAIGEATILLADVDITVSRDVIRAGNNLRAVVCYSTGVDFVDVRAATEKGIYVTNVPDFATEAVAEFTVGLVFAIVRKIDQSERAVREGEWETRGRFQGMELKGKTLGIIGFGRIGKAVAKKAKALGMRVIFHGPSVKQEIADNMKVKKVDLDFLLANSDVVSIHCPLREENKGLIDFNGMRLMKRSSYLINTARGPIIDEEALYKALKERLIAGAALDVLETEPPNPSNPLLGLDNVVITPHIGWNTPEAEERVREGVRREVVRILKGHPPINPVNREVLTGKNT